jgi:hypothetical protein
MKTTFKTILCALALSTSVAFAGPDSGANKPTKFETGIYKTKDGSLTVNLVKKSPEFASIAILNFKGEVLANEGIPKKQEKASIKFDLSSLPDGEYTVVVASKGERQTQAFSIASEKSVVTRTLSFE